MNTLRDLWRVTWQEINAKYGPGWKHEGVWSLPYEASAPMVARDMATCLGSTGMIPGQEDEYPLTWEAVVYRMDSGQPVEVARTKIVRDKFNGGRWRREDGTPVERGEKYDGCGLETRENWTEIRKH